MDIKVAREYCLSKKVTTEGTSSGENALVIRVMGKIPLRIDLNTPGRIIIKCDSEHALGLRERYNAIERVQYSNKKYWNQVFLDGDADDRLVKHLMDHSCEEVIKKFTKKMCNEYEALPWNTSLSADRVG